jgi:ADP-ribose pyrophosphatase
MRDILGEGRYLRLVREGRWEWAERVGIDGIVVVVALTPSDELLLVEQHRPPLGAPVLELPAGLVGDELSGEEMGQAAMRELEEETGWRAARVERLTAGPVSPGTTREVLSFYRAHDLTRAGVGGGVGGESITVHAVPRASVGAWLAAREAAGVWVDPKIYAGLWFVR